jgi:hypothetical protein
MRATAIPGVCLALSLAAAPTWAQIAVSSNDRKVAVSPDGKWMIEVGGGAAAIRSSTDR